MKLVNFDEKSLKVLMKADCFIKVVDIAPLVF